MHERRRYQRLVPESPLFVRVEGTKSGRLLDLSEGGLSLGGAINNQTFSLTFDLPDGNGLIQAQGEIAWTCDLRNRTGVRFIDLADACRQRLRDWVSARAYPTAEDADGPIEPLRPLEFTGGGSSLLMNALSEELNVAQTRAASQGRVAAIILAAAALSAVFVCIGYYLPNMTNGSIFPSKPLAASLPETPPKQLTAPLSAPARQADLLPPRLSLDQRGLVVQAAAMTHEDNADSLAATLRKGGFPAFVFRRGGERFYRVVVGPYRDENSTMQVKQQIEKQGFATVLRSWSPE